MQLKTRLNRVGARCLRCFFAMFYSYRQLTGRHFASVRGQGWKWAVRGLWYQRTLGINRDATWPVSPWVRVVNPRQVSFHPDDMQNFWTLGAYFQASVDATLHIGRGTFIGPNVGIITSNHVPGQPHHRRPGKPVVIGEQCWIGMNTVLLPGVSLAAGTTIGAQSLITCGDYTGIWAGNPAKPLESKEPKYCSATD